MNKLTPMPTSSLLARGTCCQSGCLHCPYGYTIKKFGVQFQTFIPQGLEQFLAKQEVKKTGLFAYEFRQEIIHPLEEKSVSIFLEKDFAHGENVIELKWYKAYLKQELFAFVASDQYFIRKILIAEEFSNQGLSKELLESYLF